ncbi:hypothetical protein [Cerasicoccus frondis]|uniref:hypothetical protein n=1 Tax=Cerasicoccus frondis TaxID=490090 RepID=UPI002852CF49|nr:hypothetical protein [Cerasicoccus frondis]
MKKKRLNISRLLLGLTAAIVLHMALFWWTRDIAVQTKVQPDRPRFESISLTPRPFRTDDTLYRVANTPSVRSITVNDVLSWQSYPETPTLAQSVSLAPRLPTKISTQEALAIDFEIYEAFPVFINSH